MDNSTENKQFEESKIFEKLHSQPEPAGYKGKLPWIVQQQIAATNGIQYVDRIGKLKEYPQYELPVSKVKSGLMLDIGCGWGRWLVAASRKGYVPVGVDIRLEFCEATLQTLVHNNTTGYAVVADLKELPFRDDVFDLVWSFSVIQHTHKDRLQSCIRDTYRILKPGGFTKLEFPNKEGFRNSRGPVKQVANTAGDYNSWDVRYYTPVEYESFFLRHFQNFKYTVHSFLGIGVLKEDLLFVSFKNKILCGISLALTGLAKIVSPLKSKADSIYVEAAKTGKVKGTDPAAEFLHAHFSEPGNNLNIIHLLRCPVSGSVLTLSAEKNFLFNEGRSIKYPVINNIPIVLTGQGIHL